MTYVLKCMAMAKARNAETLTHFSWKNAKWPGNRKAILRFGKVKNVMKHNHRGVTLAFQLYGSFDECRWLCKIF